MEAAMVPPPAAGRVPWPRTGMDGMESEEDTVDMEKERGGDG